MKTVSQKIKDYKENYQKELEKFLKNNRGSEMDFIENEMNKLKQAYDDLGFEIYDKQLSLSSYGSKIRYKDEIKQYLIQHKFEYLETQKTLLLNPSKKQLERNTKLIIHHAKDFALVYLFLHRYSKYDELKSCNKNHIAKLIEKEFGCKSINPSTLYKDYKEFARQPDDDLYKINSDANKKSDKAKIERLWKVFNLLDGEVRIKAHEIYLLCKVQFERKYHTKYSPAKKH